MNCATLNMLKLPLRLRRCFTWAINAFMAHHNQTNIHRIKTSWRFLEGKLHWSAFSCRYGSLSKMGVSRSQYSNYIVRICVVVQTIAFAIFISASTYFIVRSKGLSLQAIKIPRKETSTRKVCEIERFLRRKELDVLNIKVLLYPYRIRRYSISIH